MEDERPHWKWDVASSFVYTLAVILAVNAAARLL
jgi:hypothetical protein